LIEVLPSENMNRNMRNGTMKSWQFFSRI